MTTAAFDVLPRPVSTAREGHSLAILAIPANAASLAGACIHAWPTAAEATSSANDALNTNFTVLPFDPDTEIEDCPLPSCTMSRPEW